MRSTRLIAALLACGALALGMLDGVHASGEAAPTRAFDDPALEWGDCPAFMPKGCAISVVHGDPAGDNADVFFRVPPKAEIPLHWHTSNERMVLVSGRLRVQADGQAPVTLGVGTYSLMPARTPHSARCESEVPCVLFIAFDAPVDAHAGTPGAAK